MTDAIRVPVGFEPELITREDVRVDRAGYVTWKTYDTMIGTVVQVDGGWMAQHGIRMAKWDKREEAIRYVITMHIESAKVAAYDYLVASGKVEAPQRTVYRNGTFSKVGA